MFNPLPPRVSHTSYIHRCALLSSFFVCLNDNYTFIVPCACLHFRYRSQDDECSVFKQAVAALEMALSEYQLLLETSVSEQDYEHVSIYGDRVNFLNSALPPSSDSNVKGGGGRASKSQSQYEAVVPGLLLNKERFKAGSKWFLGRGASAAVSRGVWITFVGTKEVRTDVAVKEVPKTGADSENNVMRELMTLKLRLADRQPNIIWIYDLLSTSSTFYIVMQVCASSSSGRAIAVQGGGGEKGGKGVVGCIS